MLASFESKTFSEGIKQNRKKTQKLFLEYLHCHCIWYRCRCSNIFVFTFEAILIKMWLSTKKNNNIVFVNGRMFAGREKQNIQSSWNHSQFGIEVGGGLRVGGSFQCFSQTFWLSSDSVNLIVSDFEIEKKTAGPDENRGGDFRRNNRIKFHYFFMLFSLF